MSEAPKVEQVALEHIRTDGGTQARAKLDDATVEEYAALIGTGANVPPVVVFYDGEAYWLADGFHRVAARAKAGRVTVPAEVHAGTREDAQWYACGANKEHGLRRSRSDAQRAVELALRNPHAVGKSNREIARHVGVDDKTVGAHRARLEARAEIPHVTERKGTDGKIYDTSKRKPRVERDPEPAVEESPVDVASEAFDTSPFDEVPVFAVDAEPATVEPEPPAAVIAAPPAPVRVVPVEPPAAPVVALAPPVPTHDARGTEIPEALRATFAAMARRAERITRAAEALRAEFDELKNDLPAWRADTARNAIATPGLPGLAHCFSQDFPALLYAARQFAPQYLCEDCKGRDPACKHCEGAGWEPEGRVRERLRQQKAVATARAKAGVR